MVRMIYPESPSEHTEVVWTEPAGNSVGLQTSLASCVLFVSYSSVVLGPEGTFVEALSAGRLPADAVKAQEAAAGEGAA